MLRKDRLTLEARALCERRALNFLAVSVFLLLGLISIAGHGLDTLKIVRATFALLRLVFKLYPAAGALVRDQVIARRHRSLALATRVSRCLKLGQKGRLRCLADKLASALVLLFINGAEGTLLLLKRGGGNVVLLK